MAASPLMATATSLLLAPARLTARRIASPTASASTIAFSLIAFCGVGSAAYASTRYWPPAIASSMSLTDDVVMSKPMSSRYLRWNRNIFYFLFRQLRLKAPAPDEIWQHYITAQC